MVVELEIVPFLALGPLNLRSATIDLIICYGKQPTETEAHPHQSRRVDIEQLDGGTLDIGAPTPCRESKSNEFWAQLLRDRGQKACASPHVREFRFSGRCRPRRGKHEGVQPRARPRVRIRRLHTFSGSGLAVRL
jgi:hypothetical protein